MKKKEKKRSGFLKRMYDIRTDHYFQRRNAPALPVETMAANLKQLPDEFWGLYAFESDPIKGKIPMEERLRLTAVCISCGREYARIALAECEGNVRDLAQQLGIEVKYLPRPQTAAMEGSRVLFARYLPHGRIEIYTDNLDRMKRLSAHSGLSGILPADPADLLLAHEIFHYYEELHHDRLPTENERIQLSSIPWISNRSRIQCLSEIAGMQFAKELLGLDFNPFLFDVVFTYNYDTQASFDLYDMIMELAGTCGFR